MSEAVELARQILALDQKAFESASEARALRARLRVAQNDAAGFMQQRDDLQREADVNAALVRDTNRANETLMVASAKAAEERKGTIETLRWLSMEFTDDADNMRAVARRRLEAMGVVL